MYSRGSCFLAKIAAFWRKQQCYPINIASVNLVMFFHYLGAGFDCSKESSLSLSLSLFFPFIYSNPLGEDH